MTATELAGQRSPVMPLEHAVRALRHPAPGATLRLPRTAELRILADALRSMADEDDVVLRLAETYQVEVAAAVLAHQLACLDRAMTGFLGPGGAGMALPESARLVRAARCNGAWRVGRPGAPAVALLDRLRSETGLCAAAIGWADAVGYRLLARELRDPETAVPLLLTTEEVRLAAGLAVAAVLPATSRADTSGALTWWQPVLREKGPRGATLDVRTVVVGATGFSVTVESSAPMDVERTGSVVTMRSLAWTGLARVHDDLGFEYFVLSREENAAGGVVHHCHPRPAPGATELYLEAGPYRAEQVRFDDDCAGRPTRTAAEIPVRISLTALLGP